MNDQELIVAAAEKVCGWEIMPVKQFLRMRGIPHADTVVELEGVIYRRDARDHFVIAWNPLESIADAWMLVEASREKYGTDIHIFPMTTAVEVRRYDGKANPVSIMDPQLGRAITLAHLGIRGEL